jgi:hypothetical protein
LPKQVVRDERHGGDYIRDGDWHALPKYRLLNTDGSDHNGYAPTRLRVRWTDRKGKIKEELVRPWQLAKRTS